MEVLVEFNTFFFTGEVFTPLVAVDLFCEGVAFLVVVELRDLVTALFDLTPVLLGAAMPGEKDAIPVIAITLIEKMQTKLLRKD